MIRYLYPLWGDHSSKSSTHLPPYHNSYCNIIISHIISLFFKKYMRKKRKCLVSYINRNIKLLSHFICSSKNRSSKTYFPLPQKCLQKPFSFYFHSFNEVLTISVRDYYTNSHWLFWFWWLPKSIFIPCCY